MRRGRRLQPVSLPAPRKPVSLPVRATPQASLRLHAVPPAIPVRFPSFVFPFYTPKANRCGRLADVLEVGAGCFWCEVGACGTWVRVEPFLHVDLELVFGMLVLENIGHLPCTLVVRCGRLVELLGGGPPGMRKEFQNNRWLSEMVAGERARCRPRS